MSRMSWSMMTMVSAVAFSAGGATPPSRLSRYIQAGGRFVEQQDLRRAGQRTGDFDIALVTVRQIAHRQMRR